MEGSDHLLSFRRSVGTSSDNGSAVSSSKRMTVTLSGAANISSQIKAICQPLQTSVRWPYLPTGIIKKGANEPDCAMYHYRGHVIVGHYDFATTSSLRNHLPREHVAPSVRVVRAKRHPALTEVVRWRSAKNGQALRRGALSPVHPPFAMRCKRFHTFINLHRI